MIKLKYVDRCARDPFLTRFPPPQLEPIRSCSLAQRRHVRQIQFFQQGNVLHRFCFDLMRLCGLADYVDRRVKNVPGPESVEHSTNLLVATIGNCESLSLPIRPTKGVGHVTGVPQHEPILPYIIFDTYFPTKYSGLPDSRLILRGLQ